MEVLWCTKISLALLLTVVASHLTTFLTAAQETNNGIKVRNIVIQLQKFSTVHDTIPKILTQIVFTYLEVIKSKLP